MNAHPDQGGLRIGNLIFGSKGWMDIASEDAEADAYLTKVNRSPYVLPDVV